MKKLLLLILLFWTQSVFSQVTTLSKEEIEAMPAVGKIEFAKSDTFKYFHVADNNMAQYQIPKSFTKPKKWRELDIERSKNIKPYTREYPQTYNLEQAINDLCSAKDFADVIKVKTFCIDHYQESFPYLVSLLSNKQKVGLTNTADLIIWDRIATGDLQFYGHGGGMEEDLFTVAGRASWILNELTGEDFAVVHGNLTEIQSKEFKQMWLDYIRKNSK